MIKVVCSYCKKLIRYKEGQEGTSHGICAECLERELGKIE